MTQTPTSARYKRPIFWISTAVACVWLLGIIIGGRALLKYEVTPGIAAKPPATWPAAISRFHEPGRPTLFLVVLSDCPCSRASMGELELLLAHASEPVTTYVVFERIPGEDPTTTDLWKTAVEIPGVKTVRDDDGAISRQLDAKTSGQVLFYNDAGSICFTGGITDSRGHAGDNDGRDAIECLLNSRVPKMTSTPVYGCSLR